jgi:hypothetical protein
MSSTTVPFRQPIDMGSLNIKNVADPSTGTDAATKQYVDSVARGLQWKPSARVSPTANITISNPATAVFDGVTLASGDRMLLTAQTTTSENGLWIFNGSSSALTRPVDFASGASVPEGAAVAVDEGTTKGAKVYYLTVSGGGTATVDTSNQTWSVLGGAGTTYSAGNGLTLSGSVFSVVAGTGLVVDGTSLRIDTSVTARKFATSIGDGSTTDFTITHSLGSTDIQVQVWDISSAGSEFLVNAGVGPRTSTTVHITFATAPSTNQYRVVVVG